MRDLKQEPDGEKNHCFNFTVAILAYFCDKKRKIKGVLEVCARIKVCLDTAYFAKTEKSLLKVL